MYDINENIKLAPDSPINKEIQLEDENKCLWDEIKSKNQQIAYLNNKLLLQEDVLKQRSQVNKLLDSYLETIRTLQGNLNYLENENKVIEQKFYASQLIIKKLQGSNTTDNHPKLAEENTIFKLKIHSLEKQLRRYAHLWNRNVNVAAEAIVARQTITKLEQKLLECQPMVADCKQTKGQLFEVQHKFKNVSFTNSLLREQLDKTKSNLQEITSKRDEFKRQLVTYAELINKLRDENASMERFVEKSFRLEGALAELDDLNVVLKKQETMLGVLFDENQNLKDAISQLFGDMTTLKDRNWKLEKYAAKVEESFYAAEKNVDGLEHKLDYYRNIEIDNEKLNMNMDEMSDRVECLKKDRSSLAKEVETLRKRLESNLRETKYLRNENRKLINENNALLETWKNKELELANETELLESELAKCASELRTQRKMRVKYIQSQDVVASLRDEMKILCDENIKQKKNLDTLRFANASLQADREKYLQELRQITVKYGQLQVELDQFRSPAY